MIFDLTKGNYKNIKATGAGFQKLPPGAYVCQIKAVDTPTVEGKGKKLVLNVDICEGEFSNYFTDKMNRSNDKKFPSASQFGRYIFDMQKKEYLPAFKGVITTLEKNNSDFVAGDSFDSEKLVGLKVGGVYNEKEFETSDGSIRTFTQLKWLCDIQDVREGKVKIPPLEKLEPKQKNNSDAIDHFSGQDIDDNDIPF